MKFLTIGRIALLLAVTASSVLGQNKAPEDDYLNNEIVTITGKVTVFYLREGNEPTIGNWQGLIFQRVGCKKCLIYARADCDGKYKIQVGRGKYRVISRSGRRIGELVDILAPSQPRVVDATKSYENVFDIKIVMPFEPMKIT